MGRVRADQASNHRHAISIEEEFTTPIDRYLHFLKQSGVTRKDVQGLVRGWNKLRAESPTDEFEGEEDEEEIHFVFSIRGSNVVALKRYYGQIETSDKTMNA